MSYQQNDKTIDEITADIFDSMAKMTQAIKELYKIAKRKEQSQ